MNADVSSSLRGSASIASQKPDRDRRRPVLFAAGDSGLCGYAEGGQFLPGSSGHCSWKPGNLSRLCTSSSHDTSLLMTLDEGVRSGQVTVTEAGDERGLVHPGQPIPREALDTKSTRLVFEQLQPAAAPARRRDRHRW